MMADSTVRQDGSGDFTAFATALADAGTVAGDIVTIDDEWTIDDTLACTVTDDDITGRILSSDPAYHDGFYDESKNHYRLAVSDGNHCLTINNTGCIIDGLAISQDSATVSAEGIRLAISGGTTTINNCIIQAIAAIADQDGIFMGDDPGTCIAENTIIYGFGRSGIQPQMFSGGVKTQTWNINSCTIRNCQTVEDADGGGISVFSEDSDHIYVMNVFNTIVVDCNTASADDFNEGADGEATVTWNIDNSISSDSSITSRDAGAVGALENRTSTDNPSPGVGDFVIFKDITTAVINLLLQDNADDNDAQDAHSATSGAGLTLPILDITAEVRDRDPNMIDIGADEAELTPPAPAAGLPEYGQLRTAIGDPAVYGATILRS